MTYKAYQINSKETYPWILDKHYARRVPNIIYAFGLYYNQNLVGIITFGNPPSPALCEGVCGEEHKDKVIELNRLCLQNNYKNEASILVSRSLKLLPKPKIVVSYADISKCHVGYVYQATNFIYTGLSAKRTEWRIRGSNLHGRTVSEINLDKRKNNLDKFEYIDRPRKHRYVYIVGNKKDKKNLKNKLNYNIQDYPKGDLSYYDSGNAVQTQGLLL